MTRAEYLQNLKFSVSLHLKEGDLKTAADVFINSVMENPQTTDFMVDPILVVGFNNTLKSENPAYTFERWIDSIS